MRLGESRSVSGRAGPHARPGPWFAALVLVGLGLAALLAYVRWLGPDFAPPATTLEHPWRRMVGALVGVGLLWTSLLAILPRIAPVRLPFWSVLLCAVALRALFFGSTPIYENDFNRYLWDGAVAAQGANPYALSPEEARISDDPTIAALREEGRAVLFDINNAPLTTIYPMTAQAAFAAAHILQPFGQDGLRAVFLLSEIVALGLLWQLLRRFGIGTQWSLLYALCPLAVFAGFNTLHMDLLLAPFLLAAVGLVGRRPAIAALSLALAVGVKLWPLLLAPVLFRRYLDRPLALAGHALIVVGVSLLLLAPMLLALGADSGLQAYSTGWDRSAFLFPNIEDAFAHVSDRPDLAARLAIAGALGAASLVLAWRGRGEPDATLPPALLALTAGLLFLSPTGFPWYAVWLLPFLPFAPRWGYAALISLVALHYTRFAFGEAGEYGTYLDLLVPLQFGVPLLILLAERLWRKEQVRTPELPEITALPDDPIVKVVIPALNEARALPKVLNAIPASVAQVIVADNGSTDNTADVARAQGATVVSVPEPGYGRACMAGVRVAGACDVLVFLDGDASDYPEDMPDLLAPILSGEADMVIGARNGPGVARGSLTLPQRCGNRLACVLMRLIWGSAYTDLGPFRAIRRDAYERLHMQAPTFGWTVEMQVRGLKAGLRGVEVPVRYRPRIGVSKISGTVRGVVLAGYYILGTIAWEAIRPVPRTFPRPVEDGEPIEAGARTATP